MNTIFSYSRAEAISDGVLVDLTAVAGDSCRQIYKYPVACTAAVWSLVEAAVANEKTGNDLQGVLWDILWMSRLGQNIDESTKSFKVIIKGAGRQSVYAMKIVCGPGDDAEPVMTIMMSGED